jgi:hypothetical protein
MRTRRSNKLSLSLFCVVVTASALAACSGIEPTDHEPPESVASTGQGLTIDRDISTWTGDQSFGGTTCGMGNDYTPSCGFSNAEDVAFLWTPPATGTYIFSTTGSSFDTIIHLRDGAGGAPLACNDDAYNRLDSAVGASVTAGHPITVVVDGYSGGCGNFLLTIMPAPLPSPATLALWVSGDYLANAFLEGQPMPSWFDQSGNVNHGTTNLSRPGGAMTFNTLNGRPVVRFGGAQSFALTRPLNSQTFTFFVVGRNSMPTEEFSMILGPGGSNPNNQLRWENSSQALLVGANGLPVVTAPTGNTRVFHALSGRYDGSTLTVYRDGALISSSTFSTIGPWTLNQIGAWYSSYFMQGDIAEIVFYISALSDADRGAVNGYLRSKYALP